MGLDPESLLDQLASGKPLDDDVEHKLIAMIDDAISEEDGRQASLDDIYSYVLVLGKARSKQALRVFNRVLDEWDDALTVSKVLEILCFDWDRFDEYLERVISFAVGVSWDVDEDVKQSAIRALGEYLANSLAGRMINAGVDPETPIILSDDQREVLNFLLRTFFDSSHESWTRQTTYCALLRATGAPTAALPNDCVPLDLAVGSRDIQWDMLGLLERLVDYGSDSSSESSVKEAGGPGTR